jgi:hypothetical protein
MYASHTRVISVFCLLFSLIWLEFFGSFAIAEPSSRVAGVKVGDMAKYGNFEASWTSESPGAAPPQQFVDVNNTLFLVNKVLSISGNNVSFESRTVYRNGTERVEVKSVDLVSGSGIGNLTFVAAGLGVGDSVYNAGDFSEYYINSTSLRSYCGLMRETNMLNLTLDYSDYGMSLWTQLYWDKATGLLMEHFWYYYELSETDVLTYASVFYSMIENNVWTGVSDSVAPIARAGSDHTVNVGETISFDASESRDNVGLARFAWDFGDGESAVGLRASHAYAKAGVFNVTLTVEDAVGNKSMDYVTVTVRESATSFLTSGLVVLIIGLVFFAGLLLARWVLLRRRRLRVHRRR